MNYCIIGTIGYLLFLIYDLNEIKQLHNILKTTFFLGLLIQLVATLGLFIVNLRYLEFSVLGFSLSLLGFGFLIYSLFFALPFEATYIKAGEARKVYDRGVYAMSRHPGVVFYIIFYIGLYILEPNRITASTYMIWSLLNLSYIIFQDLWTFPRTFDDYDNYRHKTPFLIPTIKSIKSYINNI